MAHHIDPCELDTHIEGRYARIPEPCYGCGNPIDTDTSFCSACTWTTAVRIALTPAGERVADALAGGTPR